jgi:hypothetical protein
MNSTNPGGMLVRNLLEKGKRRNKCRGRRKWFEGK